MDSNFIQWMWKEFIYHLDVSCITIGESGGGEEGGHIKLRAKGRGIPSPELRKNPAISTFFIWKTAIVKKYFFKQYDLPLKWTQPPSKLRPGSVAVLKILNIILMWIKSNEIYITHIQWMHRIWRYDTTMGNWVYLLLL